MGTDFWTKAITKEIKKLTIAFKKLDSIIHYDTRKEKFSPGNEKIYVHMIFDINMDGKFTRKSILVDRGQKMPHHN